MPVWVRENTLPGKKRWAYYEAHSCANYLNWKEKRLVRRVQDTAARISGALFVRNKIVAIVPPRV
jgi:hypothetical protein